MLFGHQPPMSSSECGRAISLSVARAIRRRIVKASPIRRSPERSSPKLRVTKPSPPASSSTALTRSTLSPCSCTVIAVGVVESGRSAPPWVLAAPGGVGCAGADPDAVDHDVSRTPPLLVDGESCRTRDTWRSFETKVNRRWRREAVAMTWAMSRSDYDEMAARYDEGRALPLNQLDGWRRVLARFVSTRSDARILDVGSGTGLWSVAFATWFGASVGGVALDRGPSFSRSRIDSARAATGPAPRRSRVDQRGVHRSHRWDPVVEVLPRSAGDHRASLAHGRRGRGVLRTRRVPVRSARTGGADHGAQSPRVRGSDPRPRRLDTRAADRRRVLRRDAAPGARRRKPIGRRAGRQHARPPCSTVTRAHPGATGPGTAPAPEGKPVLRVGHRSSSWISRERRPPIPNRRSRVPVQVAYPIGSDHEARRSSWSLTKRADAWSRDNAPFTVVIDGVEGAVASPQLSPAMA